MRIIYLFIITLCIGTQAYSQNNLVVRNGHLLTITDENNGVNDIYIQNGIIEKIGPSLTVPDGTTEIDAEGKYVMPGIVDAHSHIALEVVNEASKPVTAEVQVGDAIDPYQISIYRALAGGVTTIHAMHGSANAVGGECETLKLKYSSQSAEEMVMDGAPRTIKFALGENPIRVHGSGKRIIPATRMGVEFIFRDAFNRALKYREHRNSYQNEKSDDYVEYDPQLETLLDIIDGDIIIHCHSYRADEILMLLRVLKDYGVDKIVFQHVNEGYKVAPELAEYGAMASVFSDWWAYKFEVYYSTAYNATILTENGVTTSINSDDAELMRHLYHEAAKSLRYGNLSRTEALKMITINPAKQMGIEDRVGSLEEGKDGDLAIFSDHPLSIYTIPEYTVIEGNIEFNRTEDKADQRIILNPYKAADSSYEMEHLRNKNCLDSHNSMN